MSLDTRVGTRIEGGVVPTTTSLPQFTLGDLVSPLDLPPPLPSYRGSPDVGGLRRVTRPDPYLRGDED